MNNEKVNFFNLKPKNEDPNKIVHLSEEIPVYHDPTNPKKSAEELITAYRTHPERLNNANNETIFGFNVLKEDIEKILNAGAEGIYIAIGVNPEDLADPGKEPHEKALTTILFGTKYENAKLKLIDSIAIDFCDPCPPICPCLDDATNAHKLAVKYCNS